ncbi:YihY family inner membrane protein [Clostridium bovifaecis]|uniref:YihY family inner membrane protein n=1 Tax=Clostridium bovifaecis TaxID=2184719 RepID=A0A6I6EU34_9CLOT|nr:YihY family inner membrane protein [Clostridium bovifaecis]
MALYKPNTYNKNALFKLIHKLIKDDIFALGSQLAYSLLLSFFPFLIFLFTIAGYSSVKSQDVLISLKTLLPSNAYSLIYATVIEIFDFKKGNLLSFSFIVTIWVASNGFNAVIKALNKAYDEEECRPFWKLQFIAILCTFALTFLIILSLFILVLGNIIGYKLGSWLSLPPNFHFVWDFLRYLLTLILMTFIFALLYKLTPCRRLELWEVLPGAVFTTIGWVLASMGFTFYVDNFANYSRLYGSIGAVIVLMIWLFLTSVIILIGGEINSLLIIK